MIDFEAARIEANDDLAKINTIEKVKMQVKSKLAAIQLKNKVVEK